MKEKLLTFVPISIIAGLVLFGAYQFYFNKPIPIVNNTTVQPGANLNVEQNKEEKRGSLFTGIYSNFKDEVGGIIGWSW